MRKDTWLTFLVKYGCLKKLQRLKHQIKMHKINYTISIKSRNISFPTMHSEESHLKCQLFDLQPEWRFVRRIHIIWQSNTVPPPTNTSKWLVIQSSNKILLQLSTSNGTGRLNYSFEQWGWYIIRSVLQGGLLEWELYLHETVIANQSFTKDIFHSLI